MVKSLTHISSGNVNGSNESVTVVESNGSCPPATPIKENDIAKFVFDFHSINRVEIKC